MNPPTEEALAALAPAEAAYVRAYVAFLSKHASDWESEKAFFKAQQGFHGFDAEAKARIVAACDPITQGESEGVW